MFQGLRSTRQSIAIVFEDLSLGRSWRPPLIKKQTAQRILSRHQRSSKFRPPPVGSSVPPSCPSRLERAVCM